MSTQRRADGGTQARGRTDDLGTELDDGVAGDFVVFRGAVRVAVDDGEGPLPRSQIHTEHNAAYLSRRKLIIIYNIISILKCTGSEQHQKRCLHKTRAQCRARDHGKSKPRIGSVATVNIMDYISPLRSGHNGRAIMENQSRVSEACGSAPCRDAVVRFCDDVIRFCGQNDVIRICGYDDAIRFCVIRPSPLRKAAITFKCRTVRRTVPRFPRLQAAARVGTCG